MASDGNDGNGVTTLDRLGERICVLGPSGSGKSTLAAAIGRARGIPVVHLDRYRHLPGTHWVERPDAEFARLHDDAVAGERWVMDGNYSAMLPRRLERATGLIVIESTTTASLVRYVRRTLVPGRRVGGLDGTVDRLSLTMVRWILGPARRGRRRYRARFEAFDGQKLLLPGRRALRALYRAEGLSRVAPRRSAG